MRQFRLRDLFALTLIAGIGLVWCFQSQREISAAVLLDARNVSRALPNYSNNTKGSTLGPTQLVDEELVQVLELEQWVQIPEWTGSPFSPFRGMDILVEVPWLDSSVSFHWESSPDSFGKSHQVIWNADWDRIEEKHRLEQRQWAIRAVLTAFAGTFLLWLYIPRKKSKSKLKDS